MAAKAQRGVEPRQGVSFDTRDTNEAEFTLATLQTMLMHGSDYLSKRELGRLSICSKAYVEMTEASGAWKLWCERAVAAGAVCSRDEDRDGSWIIRHPLIRWTKEQGLLECFAKPDPRVLANTGYKHLARLLLSKTCYHCGRMASFANPLTLMRTCSPCAAKSESHWLILKSNAQQHFLLSDEDCKELPLATVDSDVLFLISDVVKVSYGKYGGADGLAGEIAKRKAAATSRFAGQRTRKHKKKSRRNDKVEMMLPSRPADNLASLNCCFKGMPIPTAYMQRSASPFAFAQTKTETVELKMTHPTRCEFCVAMGTTGDIMMHERLEHNTIVQRDEELPLQTCPPPKGVALTIPAKIEPADELVRLLSTCTIEHSSGSWRDPTYDGSGSIRNNASFSFQNCKIVVDCQSFFMDCISDFVIYVWSQVGAQAVPIELVTIHTGEFGEQPKEADIAKFRELIVALGLKQTEPKQLLAALFSRAMSAHDFLYFTRHEEDEEYESYGDESDEDCESDNEDESDEDYESDDEEESDEDCESDDEEESVLEEGESDEEGESGGSKVPVFHGAWKYFKDCHKNWND